MSLVDDLKGEKEKEQEENSWNEQLENMNFDVNENESIEDQVADLHGSIVMRVINRAKLMNKQLGRQDVQMVAHTTNQIINQKIRYFLLEKLGVSSVNEIISEDEIEEMVNLFGFKQDLTVSENEIPKDLK